MDFGELLPPRSVEDILAERIRLVIGEAVYDLPVKTIAENRLWKEQSDRALGLLLAVISTTDDLAVALESFDGYDEMLMALLVTYDSTGVLPDRDTINAGLTPLGLFRAVCEVWRAARPLADIARTGMSLMPEPPTNDSPPPTPTWLRRITGRLDSSRPN